MPILTLKFQQSPMGEFTLEPDKSLSIGRLPDNDVVIDNLAVSGHHAKIDSVGKEFILTDLQSKNGTFVNDAMAISRKLVHGDVITIGKHTLEFAYQADEAKPESTPSEALFATMVMDTHQHRALLEKNKPQTPPEKQPSAVLSMLAGGEGEIPISRKLFKIGKGGQCDLSIGGLFVGPVSATISLRPDGYYLSYVGGIAKPKLNGKPIAETIRLREFDVIEIGKAKMQLVFQPEKQKPAVP